MAFSTLALAVLAAAGVVILLLAIYLFSRFAGKDFFGILSGWFKSQSKELVKAKEIPDEFQYRIINERHGFNQLVKGWQSSGQHDKKGIDMMQFKYGENQFTTWEVPRDPDYFKPDLGNFDGKTPKYYIIERQDAILRLKNERDMLDIHNKGLLNKMDALHEDEKLRMHKVGEYQREQRRVAQGWSPGNPYGGITRRYGWGNGPTIPPEDTGETY